jgi:hypothetical protein
VPYRFYITVALETNRDAPVADIGYRGREVASVEPTESGLRVLLFAADALPLDGLIDALQEARRRLT